MAAQPQKTASAAASGGEIIRLPNSLSSKVGGHAGLINASVIAKAEAALSGLSEQFGEWLSDEVTKLEATRTRIKTEGMSQPLADELFRHTHDLKGLGTTCEFPIVTRLSTSLCRLIAHPATRTRAPIFLVDAHIDAIRAAVRSGLRDPDHPVGKALGDELEARTSAYLA